MIDMKKRIPLILLTALSSVFILSFYGKVIFHPDSYLFSNGGDALKNYFTWCYHIKYDSSYINFEGMNYPYGEHFLYTDCHPVFATFLKYLASNSDFFSDHSIGILNFAMIFSIFLTFFICYFLLREFSINRWLSLLFSIGITTLSPQIFRMEGHLALSYSIAVPLSWLLIIKSLKKPENPAYSIILFINNLFWLFIHVYLGVIILFFLTLIVAGKYIFEKNRWKLTPHFLRMISVVFVPVIIFYFFTVLTDTHTGRTNNPSGFFLYNAEFDDVFLPHHPPLRPLLDSLTGNKIRLQWEAWSYVGFSVTILFIVLLVLSVIKIFRRKKTTLLNSVFSSFILNISLVSAFIVVLFAMAFPFRQFPVLLDIVPVFKQFRATGRFTWPFYFAATVFAVYAMQELLYYWKEPGKKIFIFSLCIVAGIFNITEGIPYHSEVSGSIVKSKNIFKKELLTVSYRSALEAIHPGNFQAILTLPFYYQGSESYSRPRIDETVRASIILSYQTGIPIVCANLTRTSIRESKNIVQVVSPDFYIKEILADLPDNRPFLVIRTKDDITKYEEEILKKCEPVFLNDEISVFSLDKEELFKNSAETIFKKFKQIRPNLCGRERFYITDNPSFFYYNGFEESKSDRAFRGKGGFQSVKKGKNTFAEFAPFTFSAGKKYEASLWMYNGFNDALNNWLRFIIEEYDEETNTWYSTICLPEQSETINGDWSLIENTFEVKNPKNKIFVVTIGKDDSREKLFADDLLIRESGADVYSINEEEDTLFYNNHEVVLRQLQ
jgi:hypothetical protein